MEDKLFELAYTVIERKKLDVTPAVLIEDLTAIIDSLSPAQASRPSALSQPEQPDHHEG